MARVRNFQKNVGPRLGLHVLGRVVFVDGLVFGGDPQGAPTGHRIPRIDAEVEQDLMQMGRVTADGPQVVRDLGKDVDVLGEGLAGHLGHFPDHVAGLDHHAFAFDASPESQQLPHNIASSLGVDFDGVHQPFKVSVRQFLHPQQGRRHHDGGQNVVQIVGHAAREGADALHALRAQELVFQPFVLRDVRADHKD